MRPVLSVAFAIVLTASPAMPQMPAQVDGPVAGLILTEGNVLWSDEIPGSAIRIFVAWTSHIWTCYVGKDWADQSSPFCYRHAPYAPNRFQGHCCQAVG